MPTYFIRADWRKREEKERAAAGSKRLLGLGGSEMPVILGRSQYASAAMLWAVKSGLFEDDYQAVTEMFTPAWYGQQFEPVILRDYALLMERPVLGRWHNADRCIYHPDGGVEKMPRKHWGWDLLGIMRSPEEPWQLGQVDGLLLDPAGEVVERLVDAKTAHLSKSREWGQEGTDQVPDPYMIQGQHYSDIFRAVLGKPLPFDVALLFGGSGFKLYTFEYHEALCGLMRDAGRQFIHAVETGEMPPIPPDLLGVEILNRLYPRAEGGAGMDISNDPEWVEIGDELSDAKWDEKEAKARIVAASARFREKMGEKPRAFTPFRGWNVSWLNGNPKVEIAHGAALAELAKDLDVAPEEVAALLEKHTVTKPATRTFRFNLAKSRD